MKNGDSEGTESNSPLSSSDVEAINGSFVAFEPLHFEYLLAKCLVGVQKLDYRIEQHRFAIGRALVFLRHYDNPIFKTSTQYSQAILFLRNGYGNNQVNRFLNYLYSDRPKMFPK